MIHTVPAPPSCGVIQVQAAGVDKLRCLVVIVTHGDAVSLCDEPGNVVLGNFGKGWFDESPPEAGAGTAVGIAVGIAALVRIRGAVP